MALESASVQCQLFVLGSKKQARFVRSVSPANGAGAGAEEMRRADAARRRNDEIFIFREEMTAGRVTLEVF